MSADLKLENLNFSTDYLYIGWDLAMWLERLTVNIKIRNTVLRSIPSSSDAVESEGWQMKQCWIKCFEETPPPPPKKAPYM